MSERKVLSKYYPPDFDPSALGRQRKPKQAGPKVITVRLMAPFSMRCLTCGEYLPKGRKFNARKETNQEEKYLGIQIFRFFIRCTRCSAEITFKTDPRVNDYVCERGAKRNTEPWRPLKEETDEERLDRLEKEEEERNAMEELEAKTVDAKREMAVADMLDEIRTSNARRDRTGGGDMAPDAPPLPFKRERPKKVERIPGLKKKEPADPAAAPSPTPTPTQSQPNLPGQVKAGLAGLVDYGSDSD
ncbi:hypothetical protein PG984_003390 [Apiospora sp. TS-2023a]